MLNAWAWKPIFIGHRGSYMGVMNTVEAYNNGVDHYGYQGLECDVRVTADGYYVISHDETTNSVGGNLTVANATLAELQAETYTQTRGGVTYTGHICTVAEYLDICAEKNVIPVVELKWTTGINNNDMSKFPGLAALIEEKGLTDKAIILTSMRNSLEYVRTNFPALKCQFLCNSNWSTYFDWIVQWGLMPSIEAGCFDIYTVKKFHDKGIDVAVWTVNSLANYNQYGNMGVAMITCDYLMPSEMPDLADIDWDAIVEPMEPLQVVVDTLYSYTRDKGNLPANFPSALDEDGSPYKSAQQAAITADGTFYANNYTTSKLVILKPDGTLSEAPGTNSHGICFDSAGNLIQRKDGVTSSPNKLIIYPNGDINAEPVEVDFELDETGQTNFISAIGDVMSDEGGYVYHFQNGKTYISLVKIVNGEFEDVETTDAVSFAGSTAGVVYPIDNDPYHFVYQVRNQGYYLYDNVDKGKYIPGSLNTTTPNSNSSVGGAYFELDGHEMFLYTSGSNYNGGFSIRDMSAEATAVATIPPMGSGGYYANPSVGSFFRVIPERGKSVIVYEYTMGNGYAAYRVHTPDYTAIDDVNIETPRPQNNNYYDLMGRKMNATNLTPGIYIHNGKKVVVR
jgi:glycerophosphoryl diester phosphodiesterase